MTPCSKEELSESCACNVTFKRLSLTCSQANHRERYRGPPVDRESQLPSFGYSDQDQWCQASERLLTLAGESARSIFNQITSGTHSIWQCTENTQIHFIDTFWPDMGLFDLLPIILDYQRKIWSQ